MDTSLPNATSLDGLAIFAPVFVMLMLTLVVWTYMYARRIPFIMNNDFAPGDLVPHEFARLSPPAVANPSDNLKNLFEVPVLFYVLALYLYVTQQVDTFHLAAAWVFVAFRLLHSAVHCTVNMVPLRFALYALSTLAFWASVIWAAFNHSIAG